MNYARTIFMILMFTGVSVLFGQSQLEKAQALMKEKKYTDVIAMCEQYLQNSSRDEEIWLVLAEAYEKINKFESVETAGQRVVALEDNLMPGYAILARAQFAQKKYLDAYATAKKGQSKKRKKEPEFAPLLLVLGRTLIVLDSADAAQVAASKARELDPNNKESYEIIGDSYRKQKVAPMAISSYEKCLEIDTLQPVVLYKLADTYKVERQYTDAARIYSKILNQDPTNEAARLELGRLFFRAKQWAKCASTLKDYFKSQKSIPKDIQAMYLEALFNSRQYKEAGQVAEEYLKLEPKSALALRAIANGQYSEKQYAKVVDSFTKLAKVDTLNSEDLRWLGISYRQLKKDSLAAITFEEALKDSDQTIQLRSYLYGEVGTIWMNAKRYERAALNFEKRIQVDTAALGAAINLANCLIQLERFEDAAGALKKVIAKNPKYAPAYMNLGYCYYQQKNFDAGKTQFELAIKAIDTAETRYRIELADANRMIALATMIEKKETAEESTKKWETAASYLRKSIKYKEDIAQSHLLLGQCLQNLNKKEEAIKEYKRALQLDPKLEAAKKGLKDLQPVE